MDIDSIFKSLGSKSKIPGKMTPETHPSPLMEAFHHDVQKRKVDILILENISL